MKRKENIMLKKSNLLGFLSSVIFCFFNTWYNFNGCELYAKIRVTNAILTA